MLKQINQGLNTIGKKKSNEKRHETLITTKESKTIIFSPHNNFSLSHFNSAIFLMSQFNISQLPQKNFLSP